MRPPRLLPLLPAVAAFTLTGCGPAPAAPDSGAPPASWSSTGAHGAGTVAFSLPVEGRTEPIPARAWYPVPDVDGGALDLPDLIEDVADRGVLTGLLSAAPDGCPTRAHRATVAGAPAPLEAAPLLVYSHCHTCLGISGAEVARTLATHGFVVVAPDHAGNTLFDLVEGDGGALDEETLAQRARDARAALDAVLDGSVLPAGIAVDPGAIGAVGHSFGAVTAGRLLRDDPRIQAALAMGAPIDNPLLMGVDAATVEQPVLHLLLEEDNSIGTVGNDLMVASHGELAGPGWLVSMPDAGHWSVSDLCGLIDDFQPGCGAGERQGSGQPFTYVDAAAARATAGQIAAAFFAHTLQGDAAAGAWLAAPDAPVAVTVEAR